MRLVSLAVLCLLISAPAAAQSASLWKALQSGQAVALMRHALAPGSTEPANFKLSDCATQRNLSAAGRAQAKRIGQWFRRNGVASAKVYTSQFCRCRDTARLMGYGGVTAMPALNALAKEKPHARRQTARVSAFIAKSGKGAAILVTHKWNIAALTGITPNSGEAVVVSTGSGSRVLGRIPAR